tara:strand:- start:111 stop:416 length:306 start_codon:yes stop_codon:yes gene_type:complete
MEKSMKLVRLVSGEEIIGDVVENEDGSYTISNAFNLLPGGEGKIQFIPFMAYTEAHNGVTLKPEHVLFSVNPVAQLVEQITNVKRQMDSGIITPDTGIVKP